MEETDRKVLEIVAVQGDHLAGPHSTCFLVEGLTAGEVEESLHRLWADGHLDHLTTTEVRLVQAEDSEELVEEEVTDDEGNPIIIDHGFKITENGAREVTHA